MSYFWNYFKERFENIVYIIGFGSIIMCVIITFLTFFWALFHDYEAWIVINHYGEAIPELIVLLVVFPCIVYVIITELKERKEKTK